MKKYILQIGLIILLISPAHYALSSSRDIKESHFGINLPDFTLNYAHYKAGLQGGPNK